jgi:hypothetical protein
VPLNCNPPSSPECASDATVCPTQTTTYTLTCDGLSSNVTVNVNKLPLFKEVPPQ